MWSRSAASTLSATIRASSSSRRERASSIRDRSEKWSASAVVMARISMNTVAAHGMFWARRSLRRLSDKGTFSGFFGRSNRHDAFRIKGSCEFG